MMFILFLCMHIRLCSAMRLIVWMTYNSERNSQAPHFVQLWSCVYSHNDNLKLREVISQTGITHLQHVRYCSSMDKAFNVWFCCITVPFYEIYCNSRRLLQSAVSHVCPDCNVRVLIVCLISCNDKHLLDCNDRDPVTMSHQSQWWEQHIYNMWDK